MKVLFYGDYQNRVGGAQKSLLAALERIGNHGIEAVLTFPGRGAFEQLCRDRGIDVRVLEGPPAFQTFGKVLLNLKPSELWRVGVSELAPYWRMLADYAHKIGAEAMHFNTPRGLLMAGPSAHVAGLGSVFHLRGTPAFGHTIWFLQQAIPDRIVIVSKSVYRYLAPSAFERTRLVYNGIQAAPPIPFPEARANLLAFLAERGITPAPDEKLFISLSAMMPFKGIHHLVDAARIALDRGVKARFLLFAAGVDDVYEAWVRERATKAGLDGHVHFLGLTYRVHEMLSGSDAMLLTSILGRETVTYGPESNPVTVNLTGYEDLPRSILDSLAAGTPVIATNGGGVPEQLEPNVTGLFVPRAEPEAIAEGILQFANDPECCREARVAGPRTIAERFSADSAAKGLAATLFEVRKSTRMASRVPALASLLQDGFRRRHVPANEA